MKSLVEQLASYKSVHLNHNNIKTHFIGVPLIIWSVALMLTSFTIDVDIQASTYSFTFTAIIACLVLFYYSCLSIALAFATVLFFGPLIYLAIFMTAIDNKMLVALITFIVGWVFQFIGHKFEKAKPAFIDDLNQLAIGPLFLVSEVYFAVGFGKEMAEDIKQKAIVQRNKLEPEKFN